MRDPLAPSIWQRTSPWLLVAFVVTGCLLVSVGAWHLQNKDSPGKVVFGEVVMVGNYITRMSQHPMVSVKLDDGSIHTLVIKEENLPSCKAGARIALRQTSYSLTASSEACTSDEVRKN
jgi:hypothetical protein